MEGVKQYPLNRNDARMEEHPNGAWVKHKDLKAAQSELAELQATIARLESKLNRAINLDFERRAEIERLKGERGEPVTMDGKTTIREYVANAMPEDTPMDDWTQGYEECKRRIHTMFQQPINSQPAPASVDLSELREYHAKAVYNLKGYADDAGLRDSDIKHYTKRAAFHEGRVALIDKVTQ